MPISPASIPQMRNYRQNSAKEELALKLNYNSSKEELALKLNYNSSLYSTIVYSVDSLLFIGYNLLA